MLNWKTIPKFTKYYLEIINEDVVKNESWIESCAGNYGQTARYITKHERCNLADIVSSTRFACRHRIPCGGFARAVASGNGSGNGSGV